MSWFTIMFVFLILGFLPLLSKAGRAVFPASDYPEVKLLFSSFSIVLTVALTVTTESVIDWLFGLFYIVSLSLIGYRLATLLITPRNR